MAALTTALVGASVALQAYGTYEQTKAAKASAQASQGIAQQEQRAEAVRMKAMEVDARRRQREIIRNQQRADAMTLTTTTAQGASGQGSSGLPGSTAQHSGQTGVNTLGVNQNLEMGREMFSINSAISGYRFQQAQYSSDMATGRGWSSLGSSLMSAVEPMSRLQKGWNPGGGNGYWYGPNNATEGYRAPEGYGNYTY